MKNITLFTHSFKALWKITPPHKRSHMNFILTRLGQLERAVKKDDPYADWALLNIERSIFTLKEALEDVTLSCDAEQIAKWFDIEPLHHFPEKETPRMAWLMLSAFQQADNALLHHIGQLNIAEINRATFEQKKSVIVKPFHECIHTFHAHRAHVSGLTRADYKARTGRVEKVVNRLGVLPLEIEHALERAEFAPNITRHQGA